MRCHTKRTENSAQNRTWTVDWLLRSASVWAVVRFAGAGKSMPWCLGCSLLISGSLAQRVLTLREALKLIKLFTWVSGSWAGACKVVKCPGQWSGITGHWNKRPQAAMAAAAAAVAATAIPNPRSSRHSPQALPPAPLWQQPLLRELWTSWPSLLIKEF